MSVQSFHFEFYYNKLHLANNSFSVVVESALNIAISVDFTGETLDKKQKSRKNEK